MNIYELAIKRFSEFNGEKLTIWESGKSKVWMECGSTDNVVFVYVKKNGKVQSKRWNIGFLDLDFNTSIASYRLNSAYQLKSEYDKWVRSLANA